MDYKKTKPKGLDAGIAKVRETLADLNTTWGLVNPEDENDKTKFLDAYERCYILDKGEGKGVFWYLKDKEYIQVSVGERNKFFFLVRNKPKKIDRLWHNVEVDIVFILDLSKIEKTEKSFSDINEEVNTVQTIEHRADYEVLYDVENLLETIPNVWVINPNMGYEEALQGIKYDQENDMQPYCVFGLRIGISYTNEDTCCC